MTHTIEEGTGGCERNREPQPTWLHRKAPTGLKTYAAWSSDPTRYHLDTALDEERRPPTIYWPLIALGNLLVIGLGIGAVSALRWMGWI